MNNNLDLSKLRVSTDGRVQIGPGAFISKDSLSPLGYQMALNYKQNEDGGQSQPGTAQASANPSQTTATGGSPVANTGTNVNLPSSSASVVLNGKADAAVAGAATANTPTDSQKALMDYYGVGFDAVKNLDEMSAARELKAIQISQQQKSDAETDRQQELSSLAQTTAAQNAREDAQYNANYIELERQRQAMLTSTKTKAFASNPFAGNSTAEGGYEQAINLKFDQALTAMNSQYNAAKQAVAAGDTASYTNIMKTSRALINNVTNSLTTQLNSVTDDARQKQQFNLTMSKADQANFMNAVKEFSASPDFNKDVETYQKTGQMTPGLQKIVEMGTEAGYSADQTVGLLSTGSAQAVRQQDMQERIVLAQEAAARAQAKFYEDADVQGKTSTVNSLPATVTGSANGGTDFTNALAVLSQGKNWSTSIYSRSLGNVQSALNSGDKEQAKTLITTAALSGGTNSGSMTDAVSNLRTLALTVPSLMDKINALPADQKSGLLKGSVQDMATKLGQNPDPKLQQLGAELSHMTVLYGRAIGGMRAANSASNGKSIFSQLIPNIKDTKSLMVSDLTGFTNTATDMVNSEVEAQIGPNNYSAIFGNSGAAGTAGIGATPKNGDTRVYMGSTYKYDGTQWTKQ